jgi:hypothetical protein
VVRRALPLLLAACADDGLAGRWDVALACADEVDLDAWPACADGPHAVIDLESDAPPAGTHVTLLPGLPRADGGATGVTGWVHGAWDGGTLALTLVGDADDPTASAGDRAAWAGRVLVLEGTPSSVAWDAAWTFEDEAGDGVRGTAVVRRER